jgi:hypothetical protein
MFSRTEPIMPNVYCYATHVQLLFSVFIFGIDLFLFSAGMDHLHWHIARLLHFSFVAFHCIVPTAFEACFGMAMVECKVFRVVVKIVCANVAICHIPCRMKDLYAGANLFARAS